MSKFHDLIAKLDRIPHLDLGMRFDACRLEAELEAIDPALFQPYRTMYTRYKDLLASSWHGVSIVSPGGTLHDDLTESQFEAVGAYKPTSVAEQSPYMMNVIRDLGGEARRVRLMRIHPLGHLAWHRHTAQGSIDGEGAIGARPNWNDIIVHVPIRMNPEFTYEVIDLASYQTLDFGAGDMPVHRKSYPAGEAWVFNGVNIHNVFNRSKTETRYALMMNLDIRLRRTFEIVSAAVDRYDGPWLPAL